MRRLSLVAVLALGLFVVSPVQAATATVHSWKVTINGHGLTGSAVVSMRTGATTAHLTVRLAGLKAGTRWTADIDSTRCTTKLEKDSEIGRHEVIFLRRPASITIVRLRLTRGETRAFLAGIRAGHVSIQVHDSTKTTCFLFTKMK
jgi:hypothetical protein